MLRCMRPLLHPSVDDITVEGILHALSDPVRVAIFADIVGSTCSQICSHFLTVRDRPIPKSTLSQHFKALREAGLILSERRGVEMHNSSRCAGQASRRQEDQESAGPTDRSGQIASSDILRDDRAHMGF